MGAAAAGRDGGLRAAQSAGVSSRASPSIVIPAALSHDLLPVYLRGKLTCARLPNAPMCAESNILPRDRMLLQH